MKYLVAIILLMGIIALSGCMPENKEKATSDSNVDIQTTAASKANCESSTHFEIVHDNGVTEKHFVLENDGYSLNAVYTYINDGKRHPAILFIPGSGPTDYNGTVGVLTPFEDMALAFAQKGICSLRLDKRTFCYASEMDIYAGMDEEYLSDCNAAIEYLEKQSITEIYLFGHSLGGQIATELAARRTDVDGIILFNSSARHLADIACDQYTAQDPSNKDLYTKYADAAKSVTQTSVSGYYYYGASDYYWASYNQINTANNIQIANMKTLIINSTNDKQLFGEDIILWRALFSTMENVEITVYEDISHFGYVCDTSDSRFMYMQMEFPLKVVLACTEFIGR